MHATICGRRFPLVRRRILRGSGQRAAVICRRLNSPLNADGAGRRKAGDGGLFHLLSHLLAGGLFVRSGGAEQQVAELEQDVGFPFHEHAAEVLVAHGVLLLCEVFLGLVLGFLDLLVAFFDEGLDLFCVAPNAQPPVCKILDYGKYHFNEQKKAREAKEAEATKEAEGAEETAETPKEKPAGKKKTGF